MFRKEEYPDDWPRIRAVVLKRAKGRCEFCGLPNGITICRSRQDSRDWITYTEWFDLPQQERVKNWHAPTKVVLTTAHLPGFPKSSGDPKGLRALCQRDHLNLDRDHHLTVQRENRERRRGQLRLLEMDQ